MNSPTAHKLYSLEILRLATSLPHNDILENPQSSATCRAPVCGSEMTVDVALDRNLVSFMAIRVKACALGQASAAVLKTLVLGQSIDEIRQLGEQVSMALKGKAEMPDQYRHFAYAQGFPARHGAIMLPVETLLAAIEKASGQ